MTAASRLSIAVIMTSFNRKETTLRCLRALEEQSKQVDVADVHVWLHDDSSTDGTADAVSAAFRNFATVSKGSGGSYWAKGMAAAQKLAEKSSPDLLLWLNDDVVLNSDALQVLISLAHKTGFSAIIVGATRQNNSDSISYTGARLSSRRPTSLQPIVPDGSLQSIDGFNGNIVLVPRVIYRRLGTVDARYQHAYGDNDYGLRAKRQGILAFLGPAPLGTCDRNPTAGTWLDASLPARQRIRLVLSRKGLPPKSHWRFNIQHSGHVMGPIYFGATYLRAFNHIFRTLRHDATTRMAGPL